MKESALHREQDFHPAVFDQKQPSSEGVLTEEEFSTINGLIRSIEQTAGHSLPRTDLIHTGNLKSPRIAGILFYTASKVLEHYGKEKALPEAAESHILTRSESRQRIASSPFDSPEQAIKQLAVNAPHEALELQKPWGGVVSGLYSDMFAHIPQTLSEGRRIHIRHIGESLDLDQAKEKDPETRYSHTLWREIFAVSDLESVGEKLLNGRNQMNASDYDHMLHTSVDRIRGADQAPQLTRSEVERIVRERADSDISGHPSDLLQGRSLSQFYEHMTGEPLWDYQVTEKMADFLMDFFTKRNMQLTYTLNAEEKPDAMFEAFTQWVQPEKNGMYKLDYLGRREVPRIATNAIINGSEVVEIGDLDAYLDFENRLDPVRSNLSGKPEPLPQWVQKAEKLPYALMNITHDKKLSFKAPEDVIQGVFSDLGIDEADTALRFDLLAHSASELKGWLGAAKHLDHRFSNEQYFKQMLALKFLHDSFLLQDGIRKQGWTPQASVQESGLIGSIGQYFKENPSEWTVRNYGQMYEGWSPDHIEMPKPGGIFEHSAETDDLARYKRTRSREEQYLIGAKALIEEGHVTPGDVSLEHLLTHELFPVHQIFSSLGLKPDQVRTVYDRIISTAQEDMSPFQKAREASAQIRSLVEVDAFKIRYEAQHEIDTQLSDRIMRRMIEHIGGKEISTALTQPILEVTCGDSRNEARRAALENTSDTIATLGAAGHFGIPYDAVSVRPVLSETESALHGVFTEIAGEVRGKQGRLSTENLANIKTSLESISKDDIITSMKQFGARSVKEAEEQWEVFKHFMENPSFLQGFSAAAPEAMTGVLSLNMVNFILGAQAEHIAPGIHERLEEKIQRNAEGTYRYHINLMKLDAEQYGHIQDEYMRLVDAAKKSGAAEDWGEVAIFEHDAQKQIGADFVEQFVTSIGLDVTKWMPESDGSKLLALAGHEAHVHGNNLDKMAYECGACGGHSGERNAVVMAEFINDSDVRRILTSRGIDLQNIHAIGGVYNTTTSKMKWHIPEELEANDEVRLLLDELRTAGKKAEDEARMVHELLLTDNNVEYGLINKVQRVTRWRNMTREEQDAMAVERNAHSRSVNPGSVQPEGGHVWTGGVVYGNRSYLRGIRADEDTTTFHVNAATEVLPPSGSIDVFAGVYEGIRGEYYGGDLNKDVAPDKAQQDYYFTGGDIWTLNSAGDRDIFGGLSRQLFNGRRGPATRPNYNFIADLASIREKVNESPQLRDILDLGYGLGTVYDPEAKKIYRYVSPAHKKITTGVLEEGSWEEVSYLNQLIHEQERDHTEVAVFVARQDGISTDVFLENE